MLFVVCCVSIIGVCVLFDLSFVDRCPLSVADCLLHAVCCMSFVVCGLKVGVCRVSRYLLLVVCCVYVSL